MSFPEFNFVAHASEVVCVSIGANLLLPVAPAIMNRFFSGIEVDSDKIVEQNFGEELCAYIREEDLRRIGKRAVAIKRRQSEGKDSPGLFWRTIDVLFAMAGVFLLWSGWIDIPVVAKWGLLLFMPVAVAAGWPFFCYVCSIVCLKGLIKFAVFRAWVGKLRDKNKVSTNDKEIADFVEQAKRSIVLKKNGNGHTASS